MGFRRSEFSTNDPITLKGYAEEKQFVLDQEDDSLDNPFCVQTRAGASPGYE
jgi:hypothetical protein